MTALGIFDYIKNFLVIFIYAAFFRNFQDYKIVFRFLLILALILGTVALAQSVWAIGSVYILNKDITDPGIYILLNIPSYHPEALKATVWRFGMLRTPSLAHYPYISGLFNLLILTIYFYTKKRVRITMIVPLLSGIIASVSRIAYGGLIFVVFLQFIKRKKWFVFLLLVLLMLVLTRIIPGDNLNLSGMFNSYFPPDEGSISMNDIRQYTRYKSIEIWKDHPLHGVGPGKFGGIVASRYHSYIYEEYNVSRQYYIHKVGGIEQFWFQIMAETGIIGALLFVSLFIGLFIMLCRLREQSVSEEMKGLFSALRIFIGCILIYSMGSGINIAPVLFTYCALAGIGSGSFDLKSEKA